MLTDWIGGSVFNEFAALLVLAAIAGAIGLLLRQPLIVSFIAVGILAGPGVLGIVHSAESIDLLAELGIAVLLFLVGTKLDLKLVRTLGAVSLATGLGQVVFTSVVGFAICLALGLDMVASLYVAVALTFSSTIIIVKLLSDKREVDSLHGQIALGFLIVQDIVVVIAMIALSAIGIGAQAEAGAGDIVSVLVSGGAMLALVIVFVRYIATPLTERLARSPELLITFAIALAALFAAIGDAFGFGKELGGLLAGVSLASTPFRDIIAARLAPLRDFLLLFFFVALGSRLDIGHLGDSSFAAGVLSLFVLIGNPLIVILIMLGLGYRLRTGFLAGLTVAQISEFSLIFIAMGVTLGHLGEAELSLVTMVGLITIAASTYMITYSHQLFAVAQPVLRLLLRDGRREDQRSAGKEAAAPYDAIIFGLGRYGGALARLLADKGWRVLGVDLSPDTVRKLRREGVETLYGDISDPEFIATLPLSTTRWAVSTIRHQNIGVEHLDAHVVLAQTLRAQGYTGRLALALGMDSDPASLTDAGADIVLHPFEDAAGHAVALMEEADEANA